MRSPDLEKQSRILDGTAQIIMTDGIAAVSISKIAKAAGISSGTIYTYFANKDDMLRELYLNRKARVAHAITKIDLRGDPIKELAHAMDLVYAYGQKHLEDLLLIREFNQSPLLNRLHIDTAEAYAGFEPLARLTKRGIEQHVFVPEVNAVIMAYAYTPTIEYLLAVRNGAIDPARVPFSNIKRLSLRAVTVQHN